MTYNMCLPRYFRHAALAASAPLSPTPWPLSLWPYDPTARLWRHRIGFGYCFHRHGRPGPSSPVPVRRDLPPLLLTCNVYRRERMLLLLL